MSETVWGAKRSVINRIYPSSLISEPADTPRQHNNCYWRCKSLKQQPFAGHKCSLQKAISIDNEQEIIVFLLEEKPPIDFFGRWWNKQTAISEDLCWRLLLYSWTTVVASLLGATCKTQPQSFWLRPLPLGGKQLSWSVIYAVMEPLALKNLLSSF